MADGIPLVLDIDGTITSPEEWKLDPRIIDPIRSWKGPVIFATGKAFPYPVMLCRFIGLDEYVVAENGGVVHDGTTVEITAKSRGPFKVAEEYTSAGYKLGSGGIELANRWRETEVLVSRDQPLEPLEGIATKHDVEVVDTGYAYHIKDPAVSKGRGVEILAENLAFELEKTIAIGDSVNDISVFNIVGRSFAVGNADDAARDAADEVLEAKQADATLELLNELSNTF